MKPLMIKCDCHSEALEIQYDAEYKEFYICFWKQGRNDHKFPWKTRIKLLWQILVKGDPFNDMIILNRKKAKQLADFINKS